MRVSGIAGTFQIADEAAAAVAAQAIDEHATGDLVLEDGAGRLLYLCRASERLVVVAEDEDGECLVAVDPSAGEGPEVEVTLENGQVDAWPWEGTISAERAGVVVAAWARDVAVQGLHWTRDTPA